MHMVPFAFNVGDKVKDKVTGFQGIITSAAIFLNQCVRYSVQAQTLNKDKNPQDSFHFDEDQLVLVKSAVVKPPEKVPAASAAPVKRTGGPRRDVPRMGMR